MPAPLLQLTDIAFTLGGTPLLEGADLAVGRGDRLCLVGRNGSGKSTLMRIAAGTVEADRGTRFLQPDAVLRVLPQEPDLGGFDTVAAYVEAGLGPSDDPHHARTMLGELGLGGDEHPATLSGGEARRAALVRVLAADPDILLLDEPTNHLDLPAIEWLEAELAASRAALVLVSHDRRFLTGLSRATVWLDRGRTRRIERGFGAFEDWRDQVLEEEERDRHKLDRKIAAEEDWVRYGVTARRKRNVGRMAGLAELRRQRREERRSVGLARMSASEGRTSGRLVIEADEVGKSFGERPIVRSFSTRILRGDRVGIVGANGAGKTTLIRTIAGMVRPSAGRIVWRGRDITALPAWEVCELGIAQVAEGRQIFPSLGVAENLQLGGALRRSRGEVVQNLERVYELFPRLAERRRQTAGTLSGGEQQMLAIGRAIMAKPDFIMFDEPSLGLSPALTQVMFNVIRMLHAGGATVLLVEQNVAQSLELGTRGYVLETGSVALAGSCSDLLADPAVKRAYLGL